MLNTQTSNGAPPRYAPPAAAQPVTLDLSRNECRGGSIDLGLAVSGFDVSAYPSADTLERALASRFGIRPDQALVTAGADDGIDRVIRAAVGDGGGVIVTHTPSFEMIPVFAGRAGAEVESVPWMEGAFPLDDMLARITPRTAIVVLTSPNNPTGGVIPADAMRRVADRASRCNAPVLVDLAYVEFAESDPTADLLELENVLVARTFSKAWGLAGLRVGYIIGRAARIEDARSRGLPFSVSGASAAVAKASLETGEASMRDRVEGVRISRSRIDAAVREVGGATLPSQANFVLTRFADRSWMRDGLAGLGVRVRVFENDRTLSDAIRLTCPPDAESCETLCRALRTVTAPEALLFDLDGVLADVSRSYRRAIIETARAFGVEATRSDVAELKRAGGYNNDWDLTAALLRAAGRETAFGEVRDAFERLYQGDARNPGLKETERLLASRDELLALRERVRMAVVTGRPRADAQAFLSRFGIADCFDAVIAMEDAPAKPAPDSVRLALRRLGCDRAWMVGDTVDDVRAARAAGVVPLGVCAPGEERADAADALLGAGAARVLDRIEDIRELLP